MARDERIDALKVGDHVYGDFAGKSLRWVVIAADDVFLHLKPTGGIKALFVPNTSMTRTAMKRPDTPGAWVIP